MNDVAIGLAGVGYWGSKLARNIEDLPGCHLTAICDEDPLRLADVGLRHRGTAQILGLDELLLRSDIDAVVLATPASQHAEHVRAALEAGKHVLAEKPLALTTSECTELDELARRRGLTLMVGHTFLFSEPVRFLRELIQAGELGQLLYLYAQRLNLGVIRDDLNALWNFGPHDVSILLYLLGQTPVRVHAHEYALLNRQIEDVVFFVLEFSDGVVAHVHESWLDPRKIRLLTVVGDRKMVVYDDTDVEAPVRIYDKGVAPADRRRSREWGFGEFKLETRTGDILCPRLPSSEPLRAEVDHFVTCVVTGQTPDTDARHARDVVAVLEAASRSARLGRSVDLQPVEQAVAY
jgi:predicted dehydrogenase